MKLNQEQQAAVDTRDGRFLVLATAGSGKTETLTERVKALILENTPIDEILALTFTVEAANEMGSRIGVTLGLDERGGFRTFHSFGLKLLMKERHQLSFRLASNPFASQNGNKIIKEVIKARFGRRLSRREMDEFKAYISKGKRAKISLPEGLEKEIPGEVEFNKWNSLFQRYDERMKEDGQIDFDDMICQAVHLLENPSVRARWQFKYVLADEFQDTDSYQLRILQLVSERDGNVFCVGDGNQSLYSWRGAHPSNMQNFERIFPGAKTLILPENFRSTPQVVSISQKLAPIKNELVKAMRTSNPDGPEVEIINYLGNEDEAEQVLDKIQKLEGRSAVLARTNQQIGLFETICTARGLKYHLLGKSGFWKTPEIKGLLSLVSFTLGKNTPETYPQRLVEPLRGFVDTVPAPDALRAVIEKAKLRDLYSDEDYEEVDNFALSNINSAVLIAHRFKTLREFSEFATKALHASRKSKKALTLSTVHSSKGLGFDNVFLVGVSEGKLPHEKSTDIHGERCVMYVGVSRAIKKLEISYSGQKSRFLEELESEGIKETQV